MTNSQEEYLKTIYILSKTLEKVRVTDIAIKLNVKKPSVNKAIKVLEEIEYILHKSYSGIELTIEGEKKAIEIIRKQDILKLFLSEILGVEEGQAEIEAKDMKYIISQNTQNKLEQYISDVLNLGDLECNYDETNEKCKNCVKRSIKNRLNKEKKEE